MIGLHPCKGLITNGIDEKHAGKSRQVRVRHEAHVQESSRGLHFSPFRPKEHPLLYWCCASEDFGRLILRHSFIRACVD